MRGQHWFVIPWANEMFGGWCLGERIARFGLQSGCTPSASVTATLRCLGSNNKPFVDGAGPSFEHPVGIALAFCIIKIILDCTHRLGNGIIHNVMPIGIRGFLGHWFFDVANTPRCGSNEFWIGRLKQ